jgi:hypothetical protein
MSGAIHADDARIRYDQTTKIIERFLADLKTAGSSKFWLESCNVCACACGVEAVGGTWKSTPPIIDGREILSQADILFDFCYSTYGRSVLPKVSDGVNENEIAENLAEAINRCSTARAKVLTFSSGSEVVQGMKDALQRGSAIAISYRTDYEGSGHFHCVVKYDERAKQFMAYDSWADNKHCLTRGVKELYAESFYVVRARQRFIEISL